METKEKSTKVITLVLVLGGLLGVWTLATAGDLEPSGPPGPTMKTLDEVEPRVPIHESDLPLTITEPNSYYFVEDIDFDPNDIHAITVECNDVTIDLMGYILKGPDSGTKSGVYMHGRSNVEIRNGTIRDFGYYPIIEGNASSGRNHRVINVRALSNRYGIALYGFGHLIKDCTAAESLTFGIYAQCGSTVTGNSSHNNGDEGIYISYGCTVTDNTCYNNGDDGIYALSGAHTVTGNTAINNTGYGIYVGDYCLVDQNTAYGNGTNMYTGTGCQVGLNVAP